MPKDRTEKCTELMTRFSDLNIESGQTLIDHEILPYAKRQSLDLSQNRWALLITLVMLALSAVVGIALAQSISGYRFQLGAYNFTAYVMILAGNVALVFLPIIIFDRLIGYRRTYNSFILWVFVLVFVYVAVIVRLAQGNIFEPEIEFYFIAGMVSTSVIIVCFLLLIAFLFIHLRTTYRLYPVATVADLISRVLLALDELNESGENTMGLEQRRQLINHIESAANRLEYDLVARLSIQDRQMRYTVDKQFAQKAAGLRTYNRWIAIPTPDTYPHLRKELATWLNEFVQGHWDLLPGGVSEISREERLRSWFRLALRFVFVGLFPAVLLIYVGNLPLGLIWGAVNLLVLIDPEFNDKLEIVSRTRQLF